MYVVIIPSPPASNLPNASGGLDVFQAARNPRRNDVVERSLQGARKLASHLLTSPFKNSQLNSPSKLLFTGAATPLATAPDRLLVGPRAAKAPSICADYRRENHN